MVRNIVLSTMAMALCRSVNAFRPVTKMVSRRGALMTMATTIADPVSIEAAAKFLDAKDLIFSPTSGGVNNIVQYVETQDGKKYVLRVYNNGLNSARVNFEHEILKQLRPKKLSFRLPTTIPSLIDGKSHVLLSNGAEASLFELIPGVLPKLTRVREIGRASGELNSAMADVKITNQACPTPPYYELFKVHHAVTRELFFQVPREAEA
jgi:Ser/Thr protein kinase RdoA (MazF antagonist)